MPSMDGFTDLLTNSNWLMFESTRSLVRLVAVMVLMSFRLYQRLLGTRLDSGSSLMIAATWCSYGGVEIPSSVSRRETTTSSA